MTLIFFQNLIAGGWGGGLELECPGWKIFEKFIAGGGTSIPDSRVIMLKTIKFKSSVLFRLDKSISVLQLPTHLSKLTENGW